MTDMQDIREKEIGQQGTYLSGVIDEAVRELEKDGTLEQLVKNAVKGAIESAVKSYYGGYSLRERIVKKIEIDDVTIDAIGLQSYSRLVVEEFARGLEGRAKKDAETIGHAVLNYSKYRSEGAPKSLREFISLIEDWVDDVDPDEGRRLNEEYGGYLCKLDTGTGDGDGYGLTRVTLSVGEYGKPDVVMRFVVFSDGMGRMESLVIHGSEISLATAPCWATPFESLAIWLYASKHSLVMDTGMLGGYMENGIFEYSDNY